MLALMLAYPFGYDQYVFAVGGEKLVKQGAIPFRDVMDTKPALIMYIYGWASELFGHSFSSIRIVDVIYHVASLYIYFRILRHIFVRETLAYISVFLYAILYVASGAAATSQAESFVLMPMLVVLYCLENISTTRMRHTFLYAMLCGFALYIILLLKLTLIIIPAVLIVWKVLTDNHRRKELLLLSLFSTFIFSVLIVLSLVWLRYHDALGYFNEYLSWVSGYAYNTSEYSAKGIHAKYFAKFTSSLSLTLPLSFVLLFSIGIYAVIHSRSEYFRKASYQGFVVVIFCSIITLWLENKYILYQYLRSWWAVIPFVSVGLYYVFNRIRIMMHRQPTASIRLLFIATVVCIAVFFSPVYAIYMKMDEVFRSKTETPANDFIEFWNQKDIETQIDTLELNLGKLTDEESVFFFGQHAAVYYHLAKLPPTMMLTNPFFTSDWTPERWRHVFMEQLTAVHPDYIIIEQNDVIPVTNNSALDSRTFFELWPEFRSYTITNYTATDSTNTFLIFKQKKEVVQ